MRSRRRTIAYVIGVLAITASGAAASVAASTDDPYEAETADALSREPATLRASAVLDAADLAAQRGDTAAARRRLDAASGQHTLNPAVIYRVARLAERLHDPGTAASAYRRYLSLAPNAPEADSARARLLALVAGPAQFAPSEGRLVQVASAGDVARVPDAKPARAARTAKHRATHKHRVRHHKHR